MSVVDSLIEDGLLVEEFAKLSPTRQAAFNWQLEWLQKAHKHQIEPPGDWWNIWLLMAGRGAGDRKSTRLNSSHVSESRMPSSA